MSAFRPRGALLSSGTRFSFPRETSPPFRPRGLLLHHPSTPEKRALPKMPHRRLRLPPGTGQTDEGGPLLSFLRNPMWFSHTPRHPEHAVPVPRNARLFWRCRGETRPLYVRPGRSQAIPTATPDTMRVLLRKILTRESTPTLIPARASPDHSVRRLPMPNRKHISLDGARSIRPDSSGNPAGSFPSGRSGGIICQGDCRNLTEGPLFRTLSRSRPGGRAG